MGHKQDKTCEELRVLQDEDTIEHEALEFVRLIHEDIESNPGSMVPLGRHLFDRIAAIEAKAHANLEAEAPPHG